MSVAKIALFCSGGMSSSLAGKHLSEVYKESNKNIDVEAYNLGMIDDVTDDADVIVLAPQISWAFDDIKSKFPSKKVIKLSIAEFGSMDGQVIADRLKEEGVE